MSSEVMTPYNEQDFDKEPDIDQEECLHQCTSNCRRVGCNCECGEHRLTPEEKEREDAPNTNERTVFDFHGKQMKAIFDSILGGTTL